MTDITLNSKPLSELANLWIAEHPEWVVICVTKKGDATVYEAEWIQNGQLLTTGFWVDFELPPLARFQKDYQYSQFDYPDISFDVFVKRND